MSTVLREEELDTRRGQRKKEINKKRVTENSKRN
jgi:hypothetical protein